MKGLVEALELIENMTDEEFKKRELKLGLADKKYDDKRYEDDFFKVFLNLDEEIN